MRIGKSGLVEFIAVRWALGDLNMRGGGRLRAFGCAELGVSGALGVRVTYQIIGLQSYCTISRN